MSIILQLTTSSTYSACTCTEEKPIYPHNPLSTNMVPNEQSTSLQFEPDSPPSSTPDPYSSTASEIDFSSLPSGFPLPFYPFKKGSHNERILQALRDQAATIRRPLTTEESRVLAYYTAKNYAIGSWAIPAACLFASYRQYATREKYKIPFFGAMKREGGWFDGERIQIMGRELARGESARSIVHSFRFAGHLLLAYFFAAAGSSIYGASVTLVGVNNDPRLKGFNADFKATLANRIEERELKKRAARENHAGPQTKSLGEIWKEHQDATKGAKVRKDEENSPAGGDEMQYAGDEEMQRGDAGEEKSSAPIRLPETKQQQPMQRSIPRPSQPAAKTQPIDFTDRDNNGPSPSAETKWNQGPASEGGSAWERIRREARSPGAAASGRERREPTSGGRGAREQREQREGSSGGMDDFTFSRSEQERSYAQEEAQRDFDARVEKERRGGDFSEGSGGGGRRWG